MSQQFHVLRCYTCSTFQVHQVKKTIKWACKMCGEKQSLKRNYGTGSGKDCRLHVQKLNALQSQVADNSNTIVDDETVENKNVSCNEKSTSVSTSSKWSQYVEIGEIVIDPVVKEVDSIFDGADVVLEIPKKGRKRLKSLTYSENNKKVRNSNSTTKLKPNSKYHRCNEISNNLENENTVISENFTFEGVPANILSTDSKISAGQIDDQNIISSKLPNSPKEKTKSVLEPAKVLNNSKWVHYVDDDMIEDPVDSDENIDSSADKFAGCSEIRNIETFQSNNTNGGNLFSEFNDDDLDCILDF